MELFIEGQITSVMPEKSGISANNKEWKSQQFILKTDGQYPKEILFKVFGDKVGLVKENDFKRIFFNPESKKCKENYFTDLNVWKVETCGTIINNRTATQTNEPETIKSPEQIADPEDELPF